MCFHFFRDQAYNDDFELSLLQGHFTLFNYTASYWLHHVSESVANKSITDGFNNLCAAISRFLTQYDLYVNPNCGNTIPKIPQFEVFSRSVYITLACMKLRQSNDLSSLDTGESIM